MWFCCWLGFSLGTLNCLCNGDYVMSDYRQKWVRYTGDTIGSGVTRVRKGDTAIMNSYGQVQLDGKEEWRLSLEYRNMYAYGWHYLGEDWEEVLN